MREITQKDRLHARNLNKLWKIKSKELQVTQLDAAKHFGVTQSAISQYLNCIVALNTDAILKFADFLKVPPQEIAPDIKIGLYRVSKRTINVIDTIGKTMKNTNQINSAVTSEFCAAVLITTDDFAPRIYPNEYIVVDKNIPIQQGFAWVNLKNSKSTIGNIVKLNKKSIVLSHPVSGETGTIKNDDIEEIIMISGIFLRQPLD